MIELVKYLMPNVEILLDFFSPDMALLSLSHQ